MSPSTRLSLLLLAVGTLCCALSPAAAAVRVRRELRDLSDDEYKAFIGALAVMQAVPEDAGKLIYGDKYRSYDQMIVRHAVSVNDPRGDQGHAGPCFMTFHRALLKEMEDSLLAINPAIGALPYWDITLDNPGAKYYNTSKAMFGPMYAGPLDGVEEVGWGVTSGVFGWRQVPKFIAAQWPEYADIFNGSASGYMRSASSANDNILVTRYPLSNLRKIIQESMAAQAPAPAPSTAPAPTGGNDTASLPFGDASAVEFPPELLEKVRSLSMGLSYPVEDWERCLNATAYKSWMEWNYCLDITSLMFAPDTMTEEEKMRYVGGEAGATSVLHAGIHWTVGSLNENGTAMGDIFDVTTSPNEPILFWTHHSNIDRSSMTWQARAVKENASMADAYWMYPATPEDYAPTVEGCFLDDVVNLYAAFPTIFDTPPADPTGYTHKEVLEHTAPGKSPYVYDTLIKEGLAEGDVPEPGTGPAANAPLAQASSASGAVRAGAWAVAAVAALALF